MPQRDFNVLAIVSPAKPHVQTDRSMCLQLLRALAVQHRITAIIDSDRKELIQADLKANPELRDRLRVHFLPCPRPRGLYKFVPPPCCLSQDAWHRQAYRLAQELARRERFDLLHQIDSDAYRMPGQCWRLDLPFVWGPIGEILNADLRLWPFLGCRGVAHYLIFNLVNTWELRRSLQMRKAFRRAGGLIAFGRAPGQKIEEIFGRSCAIIPGIAPASPTDSCTADPPDKGPLRILWDAPHEHRSGLPILLQALARLPLDVSYRAEILGSGPASNMWRRLARRLKVDDYCCWHGDIQQDSARKIMRHCHVYAATGIKDDNTSAGAIEALAMGLPVICLKDSNAADVVDQTCGVTISGKRPIFIVYDYARALANLARNHEQLSALSGGAVARAAEFSWQKQTGRITGIYQQAIDRWQQQKKPVRQAQ